MGGGGEGEGLLLVTVAQICFYFILNEPSLMYF